MLQANQKKKQEVREIMRGKWVADLRVAKVNSQRNGRNVRGVVVLNEIR